MDAESRVAEAAARAANESESFRAEYPTRLKFPYRLGAQMAVPGRGDVA